MNMKTIVLRSHHLLCIQKFTGHGYNPAFTANMAALTDLLRNAPEQTVSLVCEADTICTHCPHCEDGVCTSAEKVSAMDAAVLSVIGKTEGTWRDLAAQARAEILCTDRFQKICSECLWYPLCRKTEV